MKKIWFIVFTVGLLFGAETVSAQSKMDNGGIQISPLTFNFELKPGESKEDTIRVTNKNSEDLNYILEVELFSEVTNEGAPSFTGVKKVEGVTNLIDWLNFKNEDKEGKIAPQAVKEISFKVTVPAGAEPGGHYAAIFAKQIKKNSSGGTELGVSSRVGTLMLVSVPGDVKKSAEITRFAYPKFVWTGPVRLQAEIKNTGSVHYDSKAEVAVDPLFGSNSIVDLGTHTIIPKNSRDYAGEWKTKYPFGYYKLTAIAKDGEGKEITESGALYAIPLLIVVPALAGLIILLLIIKYVKKNFKIARKGD